MSFDDKMLFLYAMALAFLMLMMGCVTDFGPSSWRPEMHVAMARTCKVICHPAGVKDYDSTSGECLCWKGQPK